LFRRNHILILATAALVLLAWGCSRQTPMAPSESDSARRTLLTPAAAPTSQSLAGFTVAYTGRSVVGGNTKFSYTVTGTSSTSISHFMVGIPGCAPAILAIVPTSGTNNIQLDPATGLTGIKWGNLSLGPTQSMAFSLTFAGDVSEGLVRVGVKSSGGVGVAPLPGPCGGFTLAGNVFVDGNENNSQNGTEAGVLSNVTVAAVDAWDVIQTTRTDAAGQYSFRLVDGNYTVRIDASTPDNDYNEQLAADFSPAGPTSVPVTLGPDATVAFGYGPNTTKLLGDFSTGALTSTGQDAGYWSKLLRAAGRGQSYDGFSAATIQGFLLQIESLYVADPYQFTNGKEIDEALKIVTSKPRTNLESLRKELLIAELNDVSGKGIVSDPDLQDALLAWGESLVAQAVTTAAARGGDFVALAAGSYGSAINLFSSINNTRGGGDIPEN